MRFTILPLKHSSPPTILSKEDLARHKKIVQDIMALPQEEWKYAGPKAVDQEEVEVSYDHSQALRKKLSSVFDLHEMCNETIPQLARQKKVDLVPFSQAYNDLRLVRIAELLIADPSFVNILCEHAEGVYPATDRRRHDLVDFLFEISRDPKGAMKTLYAEQTYARIDNMKALAYFVDSFNVEMIHIYPEYTMIPTSKAIRDAELGRWDREEVTDFSEDEESSD